MAIKSKRKGKSGGSRVITHVRVLKEEVHLLTIYDKSEQTKLVYFESFHSNEEAIAKEKQIKGGSRKKKRKT
ncbi:hypothetical protein [Algoriphagus sp.]|uniref:hypothetical protein n=1 Tax=Algoriphagus sp. TaxID=1872435 RepID=UPI00391DCBA5